MSKAFIEDWGKNAEPKKFHSELEQLKNQLRNAEAEKPKSDGPEHDWNREEIEELKEQIAALESAPDLTAELDPEAPEKAA